jgi:signal transduction histidine kinase
VNHLLDSDRLWRLLELGRSLVSDLDLESVLRSLLEGGRELTGARYAAIGVLDERREHLERFLTVGIDEPTRGVIGELPRGRGILGLLIEQPRPLRLADIGEHPRSYGFPLGHPPMSTFLGVPIALRGEVFGNLYLTEKEGGQEFDEADEEAVLTLADWAATAVENARLYRAERGQRAELERAVRTLETTTEIARAVSGETRLERLLELLVKRARALVEARSLLIVLVEGDELVVTATAGELGRDLIGVRTPAEGSATGHVLRTRRSERLSNISQRLRFALAERISAEAGLLVPLAFQGRGLGVLAAFDRLQDGPEFTAEDERLLEAFAATAASAVWTAQNVAAENLRRSIEASEQERTRWARELHDETLQDLAAVKVSLSSARRSGKLERLEQAADDAVAQIEESIRGLRVLITELRPASLDALGAEPALQSLVERAQSRSDADIRLHVDLAYEQGREAARHAPAVEATIYRITQEALNNVLKHAQARSVDVRVVEADGRIDITVRDDGDGFDPHARANGFGLVGMRERIALVGGEIDVESSPGNGTTVHATIPVATRDAEAAAPVGAVEPERRSDAELG